MAYNANLIPAAELSAKNKARFPNESPEYREARNHLLTEEIELRRHVERVAAHRRALPPGGEIPEDYVFEGSNGAVRLSQLFGDKDTLVIYSMMFGPQRERACPMCTAMLTSWDGTARNLRERVALAVTARSPIKRLLDFKRERGWQNLQIYSDLKGDYTRSYISPDDGDIPGLTVFARGGGKVRHFWSGEMNDEMADPGEDPRGAPDLDSLWTILDLTPSGRGATWYPKLEYPSLATIT
ncbi:hypothetical protein ACPOL_5140 [Acidisarcina polymorpha]|uniref:DUF899 domain-containing protein n=1 Tax=Acidisarcina polymorpha TaxID=2211140 RepID=A0A2Z5G6T7_9BACT|nr:DUF899 family protein [Acidisarcina polymorpha]AXC14394.1 hypothetical protein ACPOL_5140 [Acidisarcina polymorpha]